MAITLTRKDALKTAIELCEEENLTEEVEVLTRMLASIIKAENKASASRGGVSKTAAANAALAKQIFDCMEEGKTYHWDELACKVNGILTAQKFTAVVKPLIQTGKVERVKDGKRTGYVRA